MKKILFIILLAVAFVPACKEKEEAHDHGEHGHAHGDEGGLEPVSFTLYAQKTELFVEFKPLVVGQKSRFAAHVTQLGENFTALTEGTVTVSLIKGNKGIRNTVNAPSDPGIFRPELEPKEAGTYKLVFDIVTKDYKDQHVIEAITVYPDEKTALAAQKVEPAGNELTYLKEQAWKTEFANQPVIRRPFNEVIKATGQIMPAQGDEEVITAKTSGIVKFGSGKILAGAEVREGEQLFIISSNGIAGDNNVDAQYKEAQAEYSKAKADYDRAKELVKDKIISEKEFQETKLRFENAQAVYSTFKNYGAGGQQINSPAKGFLKNVMVTEGQFVEQGQPLASVSQNKRLIVRADVSQKYFAQLGKVFSANFRTTYNGKTYSTDSLNGKVLSYGKATEATTFLTPVYFEIDNKGEFMPGSFIEVFIKTGGVQDALVIPQTALIEEQGSFYVYVQTGGESFEKREVKLGGGDGMNVQVLSGVNEGERVVTKGAYQIKLSTMSGTVPAHGHEH